MRSSSSVSASSHLIPEVEGDRGGPAWTIERAVDVAEQHPAEVPGQQPGERGVLAGDHLLPQALVAVDRGEQGGDLHRILAVVEDAAAVHRRRHCRGGVGHHRHAHVEGLHQRHAEAFVLAGAEEHVGNLVVGGQLFVGDMAKDVDVGGADAGDEVVQHRQVALEPAVRADQQQPRARVEPALVGVERPDEILDPLVGDHPADKQHVHPVVVEGAGLHEVGRAGQVREVGDDRQDRGVGEAQPLEFDAIELGVAQGELHAPGVSPQLATPQVAQLHQQRVHVDEEFRRRDVVVDQRHPVGQSERHPRGPRADREMVDQQVVGMAGVGQVAVVDGEVLQPRVSRLDEDLGLVARAAQHALDAEHFVADRVAVAERREHLVHLRHQASCLPDRRR